MNKTEIMDYLGSDDWTQVQGAFNLLPLSGILAELDIMFREDDNVELAQAIYDNLN